MAEGFAGVKVRAGLPKDNGLVVLADQCANDGSTTVVAIVVLGVRDQVHHVAANTVTAVLGIDSVEADLTDGEREAILRVHDAVRQRRTGEVKLPFEGEEGSAEESGPIDTEALQRDLDEAVSAVEAAAEADEKAVVGKAVSDIAAGAERKRRRARAE